MPKVNAVFRMDPQDKEYVEAEAAYHNITPSTYLRILTASSDPDKDLVDRVRTRHIVNELNRMALPTEGALSAVNDVELMYAIGKLCSYTSAIMTCRYLGRIAEAKKLEHERAAVESDLYRLFGAAMEAQKHN
ncbi:hypothetical protein [Lewinella sp. W8]|uniref:hypothetical protein n=1 Tax=Lewinella sp. W8 TaxID=2528208 RepID=UPI0010676BFE|nr:hypothetical protein [Lewinella sp. W8]MTB50063.1 hypothetical protein [Lewinella sp. W8]